MLDDLLDVQKCFLKELARSLDYFDRLRGHTCALKQHLCAPLNGAEPATPCADSELCTIL